MSGQFETHDNTVSHLRSDLYPSQTGWLSEASPPNLTIRPRKMKPPVPGRMPSFVPSSTRSPIKNVTLEATNPMWAQLLRTTI